MNTIIFTINQSALNVKESATLNGKVKSIYTADKNIFTKYAECILSNKCDFTSFSGIKNFVFPAVHIKECMEKVKDTRASLDAFVPRENISFTLFPISSIFIITTSL